MLRHNQIEVTSFGIHRAVERTIDVFTTGETDGDTLAQSILAQLSQNELIQ